MINQIQINNFRNYGQICIDTTAKGVCQVVFVCGKNGEGKTNILEAISLFSDGGGIRKSNYDEMINKNNMYSHWNVVLQIGNNTFSSGYLKTPKNGKRIYKVEGKLVKSLKEFASDNYILWMTYETDRLFLQSPSNRRNFIDMFCAVKHNFHTANINEYEKLTKERLKILKNNIDNMKNEDINRWLKIIEEKIVDLGLKITKCRVDITNELEKCQLKDIDFPRFKNEMTGPIESSIMRLECGRQVERYRAELNDRRLKDFFSGSTTFGPNRSDWKVFHDTKKMDASLCSAGEQKMLLSGVFLSFVVHNVQVDNRELILLLDDVIAHLDAKHSVLLFKYIRKLAAEYNSKISIWLSGTDKNLFNELKDFALFFRVHNNTVEKDDDL